jgi:RES domain-containing protein
MGQHVVPIALPSPIYRIARDEYARTTGDALSGIGGEKAGGRWHTLGQRVTYCGSSRALCLLERMIHGDEWLSDVSHDRVYLEIDLGSVTWTHYSADELTARDPHWRREDSPLCRSLGDVWLRRVVSYALVVPSAVVPEEFNILLNPAHADHSLVLSGNPALPRQPVRVDERIGTVLHLKTGTRPAS